MQTANSLEVHHQLRVLFVPGPTGLGKFNINQLRVLFIPGLTGMSKLHSKQTTLERVSYE